MLARHDVHGIMPFMDRIDPHRASGAVGMENKMNVTNYSVNETGLNEIKEFLAANHKKGGHHFDRSMLLAWASDAEFQLSKGNSASIEIKAWDSIHGYTQGFAISDAGIDADTVEIDDE